MSMRHFDLDHAIPFVDPSLLGDPAGDVPVDASDPRWDEPMVFLSRTRIAFESYYARSDGNNPPFHRRVCGSEVDIALRRTVVDKLERVADRVAAYGCELFVVTGYTPPACLRGLWTLHLEHARAHAPEAGEASWRAFAQTRVRDPDLLVFDDSRTWPAHTTGGAVDLTLRDRATGQLLDMGSRFEDTSAISHSDHFERRLAAGELDPLDPRLHNRRLLHWAMSSEGFVNEPPLYWHFDWGNQLYIKTLRATTGLAPAAAWYGFARPPGESPSAG